MTAISCQKSTLIYSALSIVFVIILPGCASVSEGGDQSWTPAVGIAEVARYNKSNLKSYSVRGRTYHPEIPKPGYEETGIASWYGTESPNRTTANGEVFDPDGITAAHKTFPLPSIVEVTNLDNGQTLRVRVNDRGPFAHGRIIDLSRGAAKALDVMRTGTARVRIVWLGPAESLTAQRSALSEKTSQNSSPMIVQLGAFSSRDNAERARKRMDNARVEHRNGLYVVYVGPFKSAAFAETARQAAIDAGFTTAVLRRNE